MSTSTSSLQRRLLNRCERVCPGINLAEIAFFTAVTRILATFNISKALENGTEIIPEVAYTAGTTRYVTRLVVVELVQSNVLIAATRSHLSSRRSLVLIGLHH